MKRLFSSNDCLGINQTLQISSIKKGGETDEEKVVDAIIFLSNNHVIMRRGQCNTHEIYF